jgi:hypothetical protein
MATAKTATLSFRIEPGLKEALRIAAEQEHRSIANMVEVMIREYCGRVGVTIAMADQRASLGHVAKTNQEKPPRAKKNT